MDREEEKEEPEKNRKENPACEELSKRFGIPVIPMEVINFFSDEQGKTLLVKGPPGPERRPSLFRSYTA